jgi:RHS repeat-associated protein
LTEENITDPVHGDQIIAYTYDPVGNRLSKADSVKGPTNYTYDENDRLLTENGTSYTYDNNGNTISKTEGSDVTTYSYDYENRLIGAQTPTLLVNYTYDADGIRVSSSVDGTVTKYIVDKNRDYAQVLEDRDGGAGLIASYVYGDDLISMERSGAISYYHYDGQMSTRKLTDATETITDSYLYDAFGILLNRIGSTINNYLYTGEQYDLNIGFYYLRARYYNQAIGRFFSPDPMEPLPEAIYDPPSLHTYVYTNNNPVNYFDPSGNMSLSSVMVSISIISILNIISVISPRSFIGRAYKAIGHYLPDAIIFGVVGAVHLIRRIPKFAGQLPFGYGPQGGFEWILNVGSSEEGFFGCAGVGASAPSGWSIVRYVAIVYRLYNLRRHYKGASFGFGGGGAIQGGFFIGGGSPIGNYWGFTLGRRIFSRGGGGGVSFTYNYAWPLSVRSYSSMWPMVGYATGIGALIGAYLGRSVSTAFLGATLGYIWPFTKWLESDKLRARQNAQW